MDIVGVAERIIDVSSESDLFSFLHCMQYENERMPWNIGTLMPKKGIPSIHLQSPYPLCNFISRIPHCCKRCVVRAWQAFSTCWSKKAFSLEYSGLYLFLFVEWCKIGALEELLIITGLWCTRVMHRLKTSGPKYENVKTNM